MTVLVQNTLITDSVSFLINRTNELADAMSTKSVTTNSNTATGNASISGTFSANNLNITNGISVGNSTVNTSFSSPSSAQKTDGNYFLSSTGSWKKVQSEYIDNISTTGTGTQIVDSYSLNTYRGAEYFIKISGSSVNAHQTTKLLTIHNNAVGQVTEYGTLSTNGTLGIFSATTNATHFVLNYTPVISGLNISIIRNGI